MNRIIKIPGIISLLFVVGLISCEEERILFDGTTLVHFSKTSERFLLDWTQQGSVNKQIEVTTTVPSTSQRVVRVRVNQGESTAIQGTHISVPETFVFPANTYFAHLDIGVNMPAIVAELEEEGGGTLYLSLTIEDELAAVFNHTIDISLTLPYSVSMDYLVGTWNVTDEGYGSGNAPQTDNYTVRIRPDPGSENSVIVDGLWEIPGLPLVMHVDLDNWTVRIESQPYGCYEAGLSEPACVTIYSHAYIFEDHPDPDITGNITPEGKIVLTSGFIMLIENHPTHSGYFFIPRVHTSTWTKASGKASDAAENDLNQRLLSEEPVLY